MYHVHTAAPAAVGRYLLPAPELSSKAAAGRCCYRSTGQTDGQTDTRPFHDVCGILRHVASPTDVVSHAYNVHSCQTELISVAAQTIRSLRNTTVDGSRPRY